MKYTISFDAAGTLFTGSSSKKIASITKASLSTVNEALSESYKKTENEWRDIDWGSGDTTISTFWGDVYRNTIREISPEKSNKQFVNKLYKDLMAIRDKGGWYKARDGIIDVLKELKTKGCRLIVSSNWSSDIKLILKELDLLNFFSATYSSAELKCSKPNKAFYEIISGSEKRHIIHFGDNKIDDVEGANQNGWTGILIEKNKPIIENKITNLIQEIINEKNHISYRK